MAVVSILATGALAAVLTAAHLFSIIVTVVRLRHAAGVVPANDDHTGVSIVRPVCGIENFADATLGSAFWLDYPRYEVLLCVAYEIDGVRVDHWPASAAELSRAKPIYEHFPGWDQPIHAVRALADLPENARRYVTALEEVAGAPIVLVSVGPERTQTIERAWRPLRHRSRTGR